MHHPAALLDMHQRTQRQFAALIAHCGTLAAEDWNRPLDGFGYETLRLQIHHAIGGQRYWLGVLYDRMDVDDDDADFPTMDSLDNFRERIAAAVDDYLRAASPEMLNTSRECTTWGDKRRRIVPANVILRTITHFHHHQGQISAMCRLLGKPVPAGLDFPLD